MEYYIIGGVLGLVLLLVLIVLVRALLLKPTAARYLVLEPEKSERATKYGKQLAKMIQVETLSGRNGQDMAQFDRFHNL